MQMIAKLQPQLEFLNRSITGLRDEMKLKAAIAGGAMQGELSDPGGVVQIHRQLDDGLILKRITCPLGVLGVILKQTRCGNPNTLLRLSQQWCHPQGGQAVRSCEAIVRAIHRGLAKATCLALLCSADD